MDKDSGQCECHCAGRAFLNVGVGCVFAACVCIVLSFVLCLYFCLLFFLVYVCIVFVLLFLLAKV